MRQPIKFGAVNFNEIYDVFEVRVKDGCILAMLDMFLSKDEAADVASQATEMWHHWPESIYVSAPCGTLNVGDTWESEAA